MTAQITWTDDQGAAALDNGLPVCIFTNWEAYYVPDGPRPHGLGDQRPYKWVHADVFGARFSLEEIPERLLPLALRLCAHLEKGGEVEVETDDLEGNVYLCYLAKTAAELRPLIRMTNRHLRRYRIDFDLVNADPVFLSAFVPDVDASMMRVAYDENEWVGS